MVLWMFKAGNNEAARLAIQEAVLDSWIIFLVILSKHELVNPSKGLLCSWLHSALAFAGKVFEEEGCMQCI